jgi:hypothetical protein
MRQKTRLLLGVGEQLDHQKEMDWLAEVGQEEENSSQGC